MVDDGLQQSILAHDSIAFLLLLVIFVDVVAFLLVVIEGVVSVTFQDLLKTIKRLKYISNCVYYQSFHSSSQLVLISLTHKFFAAVKEIFALVVSLIFDQKFASASFYLTICPHCFIKFDIESVLVCIICQKSVFFCYDC